MTTEHALAGNAGRAAPYRNAGTTLALVQRSNNGDACKRKLPAVRLDGSLIDAPMDVKIG